ncbi:MAG: tetratricopeptide repeat protein [Pyrinomonadaceae bacterium]
MGRTHYEIGEYETHQSGRPGGPPLLGTTYETYESLKRKQDAPAAYGQAISIKSDYVEAQYNLAQLYHTLGKGSQSRHHTIFSKTSTLIWPKLY